MNDLKIDIGAPRDSATQNNHFNISYAGSSSGLKPAELMILLDSVRSGLREASLTPDDARRVERSLGALEDEAKAQSPNLREVENSLGAIGRIVESAQKITPVVIGSLRSLAGAFGFTI